MGGAPQSDRGSVRFGVFELNAATGELRKHGVGIRLQDQPLKLLLCLLETPGVVCTREDLIRNIWPEGTFVDYEHGLNATVTRLRQVLGDSADTPRYVETVGRKGYRFIAPVEPVSATDGARPTGQAETAAVATQEQGSQPGIWRVGRYVAVLAIGLAAGAAAVWWRTRQPVSQPLVRLSIELAPEMTAAGPGTGSVLALSPDGTCLAVAVRGADGNVRLATRRLDQNRLTPLPGTEGARSPFFSSDGHWIAFFADGKLKKIAIQGGAPLTLADASTHAKGPGAHFPTGSWGDDGNIIAMLNPATGLMRVPSAGGPSATLPGLTKGKGEVHAWPQVLPGSQAVLFTATLGDGESDSGNIESFAVRTGERRTVLHGGFFGRYLPSGHLVYIRQNTLFAVPFDPNRLVTAGVSQPILEDIGSRLGGWDFEFSEIGSFVYLSQQGEAQLSIFWLDHAGKTLPLRETPGSVYTSPRFSPDGRRLAFSMTARGHQDIWVQDLDRGTATRLTVLPGVNDAPVWTADGANLIFRSRDQPSPGIYGVRADGSGQAQRLLDLKTGEFPASVSPDGKRLAIWDLRAGGVLSTAPVEGGPLHLALGKAEPFLEALFDPVTPARSAPAFSPNGRWMAYCSNESGRLEVYVVPYPGPGGRWAISTAGGKFPVWSRAGRELFFLGLDSNQIMVASYQETGDSFVAAKPRVWSEKRLLELGQLQSYDVAPDGRRIAAVLYSDGTAEQKPVSSLAFLLNFFDELRRRVPTGSR